MNLFMVALVLSVTFTYDPDTTLIDGFRIWDSQQLVCDVTEPLDRWPECEPPLQFYSTALTITAYDINNNESAHSVPITITEESPPAPFYLYTNPTNFYGKRIVSSKPIIITTGSLTIR